MRPRPLHLARLAAIAALLVPAVALAGAPSFGRYTNGRYSSATVGKTRNDFFDFTFMDGKCNVAPATTVKKVKIGKRGKFAYSGKVKSPVGEKGHVVIKGSFVSAAKLVFTFHYTKLAPGKSCKSKGKLTYKLHN